MKLLIKLKKSYIKLIHMINDISFLLWSLFIDHENKSFHVKF